MIQLSLAERSLLGEKIVASKQRVAEAVTEEFFVHHPDWLARYGERGRKFGIEDAASHQNYLACSIEAGSKAHFADYARWTVSMLGARKIESHFVAENLNQIGQALQGSLSSVENNVVNAYVGAAVQACAERAPEQTAEHEGSSSGGLALARKIYLQAAIQGERRTATRVALDALQQTGDVIDLYVDLFQAAQYEVGRLWQENRITVAQEHMATAITQYVMAQVYSLSEAPDRECGRLVITGIEGELHQVGANMVADVFEARGWNVRFLGTNLPHAGVLQAIEDHKPEVVGISATMLSSIPKVVKLVDALRQRFNDACPRILLGGRVFFSAQSLVEDLKAEGVGTDLRSALALV